MKIIYKNPISSKYDFLFTKCVYCGKKVLLEKKYLGKNRYGNIFYYCKKCLKKV
jgi:predicted SprT family Zn-dependent metalloprotease